MFDVGFLEILVIGIVSLIVIGPERLPAVARTVGLWVGKAQRFVRGVKSDFASELKSGDLKKIIGDQNDQISELRNIVNSARDELKAGVDSATSATQSSVDDFRKIVEAKETQTPLDSFQASTQSTADTSVEAASESSAKPSAEASVTSSTPSTLSSETNSTSTDVDKQSD